MPESNLRLDSVFYQRVPLPNRKIGILGIKFRERREIPPTKRVITGPTLGKQNLHRPAITNELMHR